MNDLRTSIGQLYHTFAQYQVGDDFSGCDHCVDPLATKYLASTPLAKLSLDDLNSYAFKALSTWGGVTEFKHFLPRLLELAVEDPNGFSSLEVLFGKLKYWPMPWTHWPKVEQAAIERYFREFWLYVLCDEQESSSCHDDTIDTVLCALGCANACISDYLDIWLATHEPVAARQLARFVLINADDVLTKKQLFNSYWDNQGAVQEILSWLASPAVAEYLGSKPGALSGDLALAVSQLDAIQAMRTESA